MPRKKPIHTEIPADERRKMLIAAGTPVAAAAMIAEDAAKQNNPQPEPPKAEEPPADSLASKKVEQLREIAKGLGIDSAGLKKEELIAAIEGAMKGGK